MSGDLHFAAPVRVPLRLEGSSLLARMIRYGNFELPPLHFVAHAHLELAAALAGDSSVLWRDILEMETGGGVTIRAPIDLRNTQFIAADHSIGCYPNGYEPEICALIDCLVPDDGVLLDIGANWGYFALHLALRPNFSGSVVAFEPGARPRADLEALLRAAGCDTRLSIRSEAVSDRGGEALLSHTPWSGQASIVDTLAGERVAVRKLDDLAVPAASLVKIDVEGAEGAVLAGAVDYLAANAPAIVFECRTDSPGGAWDRPFPILEALGYSTYGLIVDVVGERADAVVQVTARPMRAADREGWPMHLNVLALNHPPAGASG